MSSQLASRVCVACHGGMPAVPPERARELLADLPGWEIEDGRKIVKTYRFPDFAQAVEFVKAITPVIEEQGHHPNLFVRWGRVRVTYSTHAIGALTENDFIMAAKLDQVYHSRWPTPAK